jgi:hypothetical protein
VDLQHCGKTVERNKLLMQAQWSLTTLLMQAQWSLTTSILVLVSSNILRAAYI